VFFTTNPNPAQKNEIKDFNFDDTIQHLEIDSTVPGNLSNAAVAAVSTATASSFRY